jgi:hypothetical protein
MDSFCGKCGATLSPGSQFCATCGVQSTAAAPVAASALPAVPVKSSGSSAVKIILIIVLILVGLGVLGAGVGAFMVWRVSRALHISGHGDQMSLSTSEGTVNLNTKQSYTASDLGTDIYPGAQAGHGGVKMDMPDGSMVSAVFLTTDSKDQVLAFYKGRFGSDSSVFDTHEGAVLTVTKGKQESVVVTITAKPNQNDGKTQITIVHTKNNKPS